MGTLTPPSPAPVDLWTLLGSRFQNLKLHVESTTKSVWSGWCSGTKFALHYYRSIDFGSEQLKRFAETQAFLAQTELNFLPEPSTALELPDGLMLVEEWISGTPWSAILESVEQTLRQGAELFDILGELQRIDQAHLEFGPESLIFDRKSRRLKIVGLHRPRSSPRSPDQWLRSNLELLGEHLTSDQRTELTALGTAHAVARALRRSALARPIPAPYSSPLIGRQAALARLDRAFRSGGLLLIAAPPGGGKSRLLREWTAAQHGRLLQARADREVAPTPFKMFRAPLAVLDEELRHQPALAGRLKAELNLEPPLLNSLAQSGRSAPLRATVVTLVRLFSLLGSERPTALILDDAHWADQLTLHFLDVWAEEGQNSLVIAAFRDDELDPTHPLRRRFPQTLKLPPLNDTEAEALLRSAEPEASPTLLESARKHAEGNPFLLLQYLKSGRVQSDPLEEQLHRLSSDLREALAVASVLGRAFPHSLLEACLGRSVDPTPALEHAVLRRAGEPGRFHFSHDRWRDLASCYLHPDQARMAHQRAAEFLHREEPDQVFEIAFHWAAAGSPENGLKEALAAAQQARQEHDLTAAVYYLDICLQSRALTPDQRLDFCQELGDCLRLIGSYERSRRYLEQALELAEEPNRKTAILMLCGDVEFKENRLERARDRILEGLAVQNESLPRSYLLGLISELGRQFASHLWRRLSPPQKRLEDSPRDRRLVDLYNRLAYILWFFEGPIPSVWAHLRELNLAESYAESPQLSKAWANHAIAMSAIPWWSRALKYGRRAVESARRQGDRWGQGQAAHFYGATLLGAGRLREARECLAESCRLLAETGDRWEENGARYHRGLVSFHLGAMEKAVSEARETHRSGLEINDRLAAGDNLYTWARAGQGRIPRESLEQEKQFQSLDIQRECELLAAEALLELREGRAERAAELLGRAHQRYHQQRVFHFYASSLPCWWTTACRLAAQQTTGADREHYLNLTRRALRAARWMSWRYPTNRPHYLRERGLYELLNGRIKRGLRSLKSAREKALKLELGYEAVLTYNLLLEVAPMEAARVHTPPAHLDSIPIETDWLLGRDARQLVWASRDLPELARWSFELANGLTPETVLQKFSQGLRDLLGMRAVHLYDLEAGEPRSKFAFGPEPNWPPEHNTGWWAYRLNRLDSLGKIERPPERWLLLLPSSSPGGAHQKSFVQRAVELVIERLGQLESKQDEAESRRLLAPEELMFQDRILQQERQTAYLIHDLRNILAGVTGSAELLCLGIASERDRPENAARLLEAARQAVVLLDSHQTRQSHSSAEQIIELDSRLQRTEPFLRTLCGPQIQLQYRLDSKSRLRTDPIALDRLILNLVLNARDAIGECGTITVRSSSVLLCSPQPGKPHTVPTGNYYLVEVSDDGSGIPPALQDRIFVPDFTTKGSKGSGSGLPFVLEQMERLGGFVTYGTGPEGSTFRLYFLQKSHNDRVYPTASS